MPRGRVEDNERKRLRLSRQAAPEDVPPVLELAPWIEFGMPHDWFFSIRQARDAPWVFLANDLGTVAAVSEQEYQFEFFTARTA
ncbi:hypothetical protein [Streptomyces sp. NPDC020298]|uniref:hypothetical protein n=1 Tax=unclassified Streptomyces TaxID=2593676 RepID=UPI0033EAE199